MAEPTNIQDLRDATRRQVENFRQQELVMDMFEFLPLLNDDGGGYLAVDADGVNRQAWMHRNDAGDWDVVFLSQEQAEAVYHDQAKDIVDQHRESALDTETNGELGWFDNRNPNGDPREVPDISTAWGLMGDDFRGRFDADTFQLVHVTDDGAEIIDPSNDLYPPEAFDTSSGVLNSGYRLQISDLDNIPENLPAGMIDADGFVDSSQLRMFMLFQTPDPDDPERMKRFRPEDEGFVIDRLRADATEPAVINAALAIGAHVSDQKPNSENVEIAPEDLPVLTMEDTPEAIIAPVIERPDYSRVNEAMTNATVDDGVAEQNGVEAPVAAPIIEDVVTPVHDVDEQSQQATTLVEPEIYRFRDAIIDERYEMQSPEDFLESIRLVSQGHRNVSGEYFGIDQTLNEIESHVNNARFALQGGQDPSYDFDMIMARAADHPAHSDIVSHYAIQVLAGNDVDRDEYEQMMRDRYEGNPVDLPPVDMGVLTAALQSNIENGQNPVFAVQAMQYGASLINNVNAEPSIYDLTENAKESLRFVEQQLRDMPENAQQVVTHAMEANPHFADVIARFALNRLDDGIAPVSVDVFLNQMDYKANAIQTHSNGVSSTFEDAAAPVEDISLSKDFYYDLSDDMIFNMVREEGGIAAILADHAENGIDAFPFTPVAEDNGLVQTILENGNVHTIWQDADGNQILFTPEQLGEHMSGLINVQSGVSDQQHYFAQNPEIEPAVQAIALGLHAAQAVENGNIQPTINNDVVEQAPIIEQQGQGLAVPSQ